MEAVAADLPCLADCSLWWVADKVKNSHRVAAFGKSEKIRTENLVCIEYKIKSNCQFFSTDEGNFARLI
jgi:hypothetical protein